MSWIDIAAIDDIPLRGARKIKTPQGCVALFRTDADQVFAVTDRCPHKGGPLSEGIVHGQSITCPLHNWVFDLTTGQASAEDGAVQTFAVRTQDGRVLIDGDALGVQGAA